MLPSLRSSITQQNPSDLYDVMKRFDKQQIMCTSVSEIAKYFRFVSVIDIR